jgi:hypothetical protein
MSTSGTAMGSATTGTRKKKSKSSMSSSGNMSTTQH